MRRNLIAALSVSGVLLGATVAHGQAAPPWKSADVGDVGTPGHITVGSSNDWHVAGAGSDIWGRRTASSTCIGRLATAASSRMWTLKRIPVSSQKRAS